jgi:hypothetical protein
MGTVMETIAVLVRVRARGRAHPRAGGTRGLGTSGIGIARSGRGIEMVLGTVRVGIVRRRGFGMMSRRHGSETSLLQDRHFERTREGDGLGRLGESGILGRIQMAVIE